MSIRNVILSGGKGSRLWPLSRRHKPKQYLEIFQGNSLFNLTISRNKKFVDSLIIISNSENFRIGEKWLNDLTQPKLSITESLSRNTAAAISFACFSAEEEDILLITPSDHIIDNDEEYELSIHHAISLAKQGYIATLGINPIKPETGYGYIEYEGEDVIRFREKPNKETAIEFIKSGRFMWNSGIFCFKAKTLLEELRFYDPEIFSQAKAAWENRTDDFFIPEEWMQRIPSQSIDYIVMERSKKIKMVNSKFFWSDLGTFDSLYDYLVRNGHPIDEFGNMYIGHNEKFAQFIGIKDSIVVDTEDVIIVLDKNNAHDVKNIYENIQKHKPYLT